MNIFQHPILPFTKVECLTIWNCGSQIVKKNAVCFFVFFYSMIMGPCQNQQQNTQGISNGSVLALTFGASYRWVTGNRWHATPDTWHLTHNNLHMTPDINTNIFYQTSCSNTSRDSVSPVRWILVTQTIWLVENTFYVCWN